MNQRVKPKLYNHSQNTRMSKKNYIKKGFQGEKIKVVPRELLKSYITSNLNKNLYLTDVGYYPQARNHYRMRPKGSNEYILIYCVEGFGCVQINDTKHQLTPHSFYIIKADTPHCYFANEKNPWSIYWVHFKGEFSHIFYEKFKNLNKGQCVKIPFERNNAAEFEYIINLIGIKLSKDLFEYACILLYKTIGSFLYYPLRSKSKITNTNESLIDEIKEYLNKNVAEKLTISMIANKFNKSKSSIFSLFKQSTGYSIIHYFNLIKVQHACELMNLTEMSSKEISYTLNFQDPLYFSRLFKKYMGVSPSEYRKNL